MPSKFHIFTKSYSIPSPEWKKQKTSKVIYKGRCWDGTQRTAFCMCHTLQSDYVFHIRIDGIEGILFHYFLFLLTSLIFILFYLIFQGSCRTMSMYTKHEKKRKRQIERELNRQQQWFSSSSQLFFANYKAFRNITEK